jgi:adenylosuccinate synthase
MTIKVVIGTAWGDEAKGKISDFIGQEFNDGVDLFARWQGGNNAGHTVVIDGEKFKLNYLPAGAASGVDVMLGHNMVIHPQYLIRKEIEQLKGKSNWNPQKQLHISDRAHITLDQHIVLDGVIRARQGKFSAESTLRGIAPTYADKSLRFGIRFADILDEKRLPNKLEAMFRHHQPLFEAISESEMLGVKSALENMYGTWGTEIFENGSNLDIERTAERCLEIGETLSNNIKDTTLLIHDLHEMGSNIICEGAQGVMLDVDHGAYPYTTSSNMVSDSVCAGLGINHKMIAETIGVYKAWLSRVGGGPLPTELYLDPELKMTKEQQDDLARKTGETGTTTGRCRRLAWTDGINLKHVARLTGLDRIAVTKLDTITEIRPFSDYAKIGVRYHLQNRTTVSEAPPANWNLVEGCSVKYEKFKLWDNLDNDQWADVAETGKLPETLNHYVRRIADLANVKNMILSFGPGREATMHHKI